MRIKDAYDVLFGKKIAADTFEFGESLETQDALPSSYRTYKGNLVKGDGRAEFLGVGTEQEYLESLEEEQGWKKWFKKNKI